MGTVDMLPMGMDVRRGSGFTSLTGDSYYGDWGGGAGQDGAVEEDPLAGNNAIVSGDRLSELNDEISCALCQVQHHLTFDLCAAHRDMTDELLQAATEDAQRFAATAPAGLGAARGRGAAMTASVHSLPRGDTRPATVQASASPAFRSALGLAQREARGTMSAMHAKGRQFMQHQHQHQQQSQPQPQPLPLPPQSSDSSHSGGDSGGGDGEDHLGMHPPMPPPHGSPTANGGDFPAEQQRSSTPGRMDALLQTHELDGPMDGDQEMGLPQGLDPGLERLMDPEELEEAEDRQRFTASRRAARERARTADGREQSLRQLDKYVRKHGPTHMREHPTVMAKHAAAEQARAQAILRAREEGHKPRHSPALAAALSPVSTEAAAGNNLTSGGASSRSLSPLGVAAAAAERPVSPPSLASTLFQPHMPVAKRFSPTRGLGTIIGNSSQHSLKRVFAANSTSNILSGKTEDRATAARVASMQRKLSRQDNSIMDALAFHRKQRLEQRRAARTASRVR